MIPFVITIDQAAAAHSSLAFMFWGEGLFVFPLMRVYTAISCHVFQGQGWASLQPLLAGRRSGANEFTELTVVNACRMAWCQIVAL
jgi:hypothetical protein